VSCNWIRRLLTTAGMLAVVAMAVSAHACRQAREIKPRIVFIAPLVNLSADPALDWFGRAVASLIVARTVGNSDVQTIESTDATATHRLEGYFSETSGTLNLHTAVRDLATQKVVSTATASGSASDLLRITEAMAREIGGPVRPYTTANADAIRKLFQAAGSSSVDDILTHIDAAISADPRYGAAHVARIEVLMNANRRDEALKALEAASAGDLKMTEEDKLGLGLARARLSGRTAERARLTHELARVRRGDIQLWRNAADLALLVKDYPMAIDSLNNAIKLEATEVALWNTLGYAHAYAGDLGAAKKALEEYRRLSPDDANALDSLGEVHYYLGRFAEAEKYFLESFSKNKALLGGGDALRAAMARLLMGDRSAADKHFATYIELRKQSRDVLVPVREALWQFWTGHRRQAIAELEKVADPPEAAVAARVLLSLWHVQFGDLERARALADDAGRAAKTPQASSWAMLARFLSSPPTLLKPEALASITDPGRRQLLGYSLLLHRNYVDAAKIWSAAYENTSATTANDERLLLAWAETERGNLAATATLMRAYSLPPSGVDPGTQSILFPRSIFLKAVAEQQANNSGEAKRLFKLFLDYSADRDFIYGEERRAREAVAKP
jgi:tetratricopeptide (TPR) repeat protein